MYWVKKKSFSSHLLARSSHFHPHPTTFLNLLWNVALSCKGEAKKILSTPQSHTPLSHRPQKPLRHTKPPGSTSQTPRQAIVWRAQLFHKSRHPLFSRTEGEEGGRKLERGRRSSAFLTFLCTVPGLRRQDVCSYMEKEPGRNLRRLHSQDPNLWQGQPSRQSEVQDENPQALCHRRACLCQNLRTSMSR